MTKPQAQWSDLGERPWLVLGGGGLKGLAHIGVWRWLRETGLEVAGILGCSIGALVAACIGAGMDAREMTHLARDLKKARLLRVNRRVVLINGIKAPSVFRGDTFRAFLEDVLPVQSWANMVHPVQINAVNLGTGFTEWFGTGARTDVSVVDAVYASAALPGIFPPAQFSGEFFIDGGFNHSLPLERSIAVNATGVIAVDAGSGQEAEPEVVVEQGLVSIQQRAASILIGAQRRASIAAWEGLPTSLIRPRLDGYGTFDFNSLDYFLDEGYRAARHTLCP